MANNGKILDQSKTMAEKDFEFYYMQTFFSDAIRHCKECKTAKKLITKNNAFKGWFKQIKEGQLHIGWYDCNEYPWIRTQRSVSGARNMDWKEKLSLMKWGATNSLTKSGRWCFIWGAVYCGMLQITFNALYFWKSMELRHYVDQCCVKISLRSIKTSLIHQFDC